MACVLGLNACNEGKNVKFYRTSALVNQLSEAKKKGNLSTFLKRFEKLDLLILDEWGYVPLDREGAQLVFQIISDCYERCSIILTTNLEFSRWVSILYDENMTAALIDRLVHHSHLVLFNGSSELIPGLLIILSEKSSVKAYFLTVLKVCPISLEISLKDFP